MLTSILLDVGWLPRMILACALGWVDDRGLYGLSREGHL